MRIRVVALALGLSIVAGCGQKDGGGGGAATKQEEVKWPAAPSDDTPVVAEFLRLEGDGDDREAIMRFHNFTDKSINTMHMRLSYLDESGKELKQFPYSLSKRGLIDAKGHVEKDVGAFIPDATKTVTAEMIKIEFGDGSTWQKK